MVLLIADRLVDGLVKQYIFNAGVNTVNSTFSFWDANMWERLLSFTGLQTIIKIIYGWLFNVFTGSGGLVCLGLCVTLVCCFRYKSSEGGYCIHLISVFSLLCFVGAFALGGLFSSPIFICIIPEKWLEDATSLFMEDIWSLPYRYRC